MATLPKNKRLKRRPPPDGVPNPTDGVRPPPHGTPPPTDGYHPPKNKNKNRKKKNRNRNRGSNYGSLGGYEGVPRKRVNRLVNGLIRDEIRDLRRENKGLNRQFRNDRSVINRDYERGLGDLSHIFGETGSFMENMNQQNQAMYNQAGVQTEASTAELLNNLQATYGGAQAGISDEMARLGISQGTNQTGIIGDQGFAQGIAQQAGANSLSSLNMAQTNSNSLAGILQGMNQGSYQSAVGQNLNARNDQLNAARQDRLDNRNEVIDAIRDTKAGRRDLFMQMLQQLDQTGWSKYMDNAQLRMQLQQHRKSMGRGKKKKRR